MWREHEGKTDMALHIPRLWKLENSAEKFVGTSPLYVIFHGQNPDNSVSVLSLPLAPFPFPLHSHLSLLTHLLPHRPSGVSFRHH